ncbi:MAG: hypothetical protein HY286_03870 [Planctomycetes bacterium]|nr:hypothetical protein [Planctomycetota bacterium]
MNLTGIVSTIFVAAVAAVQNVPEHNNWRLTIECDRPQAIILPSSAGGPKTVWCLPFTIMNKTGAAHMITPFINMSVETNKPAVAAGYEPKALEYVKRRLHDDQLTDVYDLSGGIEDGASKRCVAIFDGVDPFANHYTFHFQGFASPLWRRGSGFTQQTVEYQATFMRIGNEFQICSGAVNAERSEWKTLETKKVR